MPFRIESRPSNSPLATSVWRTESGDVDSFMSLACTQFSLVFTRQHGGMRLTFRGPETMATVVECPAEAEFLGVQFKLGTSMTGVAMTELVDGTYEVGPSREQAFSLDGSRWDFPTYENVDTFLERLRREDVLRCDGVVEAVLQDEELALSSRSVQRRFVNATGL